MLAMDDVCPQVDGVLETALYVGSLERSRDFYRRLMGFPVFLEDERMVALGVPGRGVLLLFARGGSAEGSETPVGKIPGHDGRGTLHLAFAIPPDALAAWEAHLAAQGVPVESRITWPRGGTSLYFRDPDGHAVEVATPGLWPNY
jgi:catechol 2,3-dioxygenase-like lactoylglutathione lyase family enzyme